MSGLPSDLLNKLRPVLARHPAFESDGALQALFVDSRIAHWKNDLQTANNPQSRIDLFISDFDGKQNERGENALWLCLQVLAEKIHPQDGARAELERLIEQLGGQPRPERLLRYLQTIIEQSQTITLPYASDGLASLPLHQIYVALRADPSSPIERRASQKLIEQLAQEFGPQPQPQLLYRLVALNPYAGRFLLSDEALRRELSQQVTPESYHLAEIVRRHRWLILLGDPGSGKSTLCRWLALQTAQALQDQKAQVLVPAGYLRPTKNEDPATPEALGPARLPLFIRLADYVAYRWPPDGPERPPALADYIGQAAQNLLTADPALSTIVADYRDKGRLLYLLDGLDEVTNLTQRQALVVEIEDLIRHYLPDSQGRCPLDATYHPLLDSRADSPQWGGNQIIITSRIVGYHLRSLHANLPHFIIQPMEDEAVRRFCHNWAIATNLPDQAAFLTQSMLEHPNPTVSQQMARNPLLLTILAQIFRANPGQGLPANRADLYRQASVAVFYQRRPEQWTSLAKQVKDPNHRLPPLLERLTAHLAFRLHANPQYPAALADQATLQAWLIEAIEQEPELRANRHPDDVAEDFLEQAAKLSGFLVARGDRVYGFLHRQFQEYFAARHLSQQLGPQTKWQPLLERLANPNWREVLLLVAGIYSREKPTQLGPLLLAVLEAPDPTDDLLPHNLLLAADMLNEAVVPPAADVVRRLANGLIAAYQPDQPERLKVIEPHLDKAFARLPRRVGRQDPVGEALCAALGQPASQQEDDPNRFLRLAALRLLNQNNWDTPATAQAVQAAWRAHLEPAATMQDTLARLYRTNPAYLALPPVQQQLAALWPAIMANPHWQAVVRALYLDPGTELWQPAALIRDSILSPDLLPLLAQDPTNRPALVDLLERKFGEGLPLASREAGLALAYLGQPGFARRLSEGRVQNRSLRAILNPLALALDRDLDFALAFALALARDLARDLALALARDLALAPDLDLDLDLARDLARARALDLDLAFDLARARKLNEFSAELQNLVHHIDRMRQDESVDSLLRDGLNAMSHKIGRWQVWWQGEAGGLFRFWQEWAAISPPSQGVEIPAIGRHRLNTLPQLLALTPGREALSGPQLARLDGSPLAYLSATETTQARAALQQWLAGSPLLAGQGALLLAEMGQITPQTLPLLLNGLQDSQDLIRYRAQAALNRRWAASVLGRETIEALAASCDQPQPILPSTYLDWALKNIGHNRPDWLAAWAAAGQTTLLSRLHHLASPAAWATYLELLATSNGASQTALLDSAAWLLRLSEQAEEETANVARWLLSAAENGPALAAVGHWQKPEPAAVAHLLTLAQVDQPRHPATLYQTLARLSGRASPEQQQAIGQTLVQALPQEGAAAALVRWQAGRQTPDPLAELQKWLPDSQQLLQALLPAGSDDDLWGDYHQKIVNWVCQLVQGHETLLPQLLQALQEALAGSEWPPKQMALAAVAACAAAMPDALNLAWPRPHLESLLIGGTKDAGSHNSRRFGLTALSHLHLVSPAVIQALLSAAQDVDIVQQDAIAAIGRFRHLSSHFADESALEPLAAALASPSQATAYLAVHLLAALGSSPAALEIPGLSQRIARLLAATSRQPNANQPVYLLGKWRPEEKESLLQVALAGLRQLMGW